ncbi:rhombosortase [Amphritea sp. HPY]|uniref:rhombosortase n=1 Tax=Amphritea sp. HPY TaxID=3421652 RepID=UPI003D7C7FAD
MRTLIQNLRIPPAPAGGKKLPLPWFSILIALLTLPLSLSDSGFNFAYFDTQLINAGQYWRLFSGHLSHISPSHLLWDLIAFLLASCYLEYHNRRLAVLSVSAGICSVNLLLISDIASINSYAGLSGLLFAPLTISLIMFGIRSRSATGWLPLLICTVKVIGESISGVSLLSDSLWPPYPPAHLAGILGGCSALLLWRLYGNWQSQYSNCLAMLSFMFSFSAQGEERSKEVR